MRIDVSGSRPGFQLNDPDILLDDYQREALAFDREIIVSAGAGSGKTSTLSLRYTRLLVECAWEAAASAQPDCPIEQVLVLTFTDKAAQEMAERCERQFRQFVAAAHRQEGEILGKYGATAGARFIAHLDSLIGQFGRARVSTFHSFYTTVLREHALSLGLSPGFRLADDLERRELFKDVAHGAFESWREETEEATYRELAHDLGGRSGIEQAVIKLFYERSKFHRIPDDWSQEGTLLQTLLEEATLEDARVDQWLSQEVRPVVHQIAGLLAPSPTNFAKSVTALARQLTTLPSNSLEKNQIARDVCTAFFSKEKPRNIAHANNLGKKDDWEKAGEGHLLGSSKIAMKELQPKVDAWSSIRPEIETLPVLRDVRADRGTAALWSLYASAVKELRKVFSVFQLEDFDGLELHVANKLNSDPEFSATLAAGIRYVMVDEFQDTNALQWEILQHLGRPGGVASDRLFAVGDLKQAIYSFRGGDVTVFSEAMASIDTQVDLRYNYRSTPDIVAFNNELFAGLMGSQRESRPSWEAHYTEVEAGRHWETSGEIGAWSYPRVSAKEAAALEAKWIADQCRRLLDPDGPYKTHQFFSTAAHTDPPIAILLRKRTHLPAYQQALTRAGIPCRLVKGVGFWQRREVLDLLLALQAAVRGDPTSVVGFLRSPLACVGDDTIAALSEGQFGPTHRAFVAADLHPSAPKELVLAQRTLRTLSRMAPHKSLRSLAEETLRRCAAHHAWAEDSGLNESEANVLKFLQLCSEYGNMGWSHGRILHLFEQEAQSGVREKEADASGGEARVLIQTVHSAKGLQFPVVFLPALGSETSVHDGLSVGRTGEKWTASYKVHDPAAPNQTKNAPLRYSQLHERRKAEEAAESLRKLYVATTRAESHLYFVGAFEKPSANSWAAWLKPSIETEWGPTLLESTETDGSEDSQTLDPTPLLVDAPVEYLRAEQPGILRVTPSSLRLYKSCPMKWKLTQSYGSQRPLSTHNDRVREAAAKRGDLLHDLIDKRRLNSEKGAALWRSIARLEAWPDSVVAQQEARLRSDLEVLSASDSFREMLNGEAYSEPGFEVHHGQVRLHGRVDLLWREGDTWILTDFKSEDLSSASDIDREHRDQLTAYAWASSQLLGEPVFTIELFGTRDGRRYPLRPLNPQDFHDFEALLKSIEEDATLPAEQLEARVLSEELPRPCDNCSFRSYLCKGRPSP